MSSAHTNFQTLPEAAGFISGFIAQYGTKFSITFKKKHSNIHKWQAFTVYVFTNKICGF